MGTIEVRAGEGGADAEAFAAELAFAIGKFSNSIVDTDGKVSKLHRL